MVQTCRIGLLAVAVAMSSSGAARAQVVAYSEGKLKVHAEAAPLPDVLEAIGQKAGVKVVYDPAAPRPKVTLNVDAPLLDAVRSVLAGQPVTPELDLDPKTGRLAAIRISAKAAPPAGVPRPMTPEEYVKTHAGKGPIPGGSSGPPGSLTLPPGMSMGPPPSAGSPPAPPQARPEGMGGPAGPKTAYPLGMRPVDPSASSLPAPPQPTGMFRDGRIPSPPGPGSGAATTAPVAPPAPASAAPKGGKSPAPSPSPAASPSPSPGR